MTQTHTQCTQVEPQSLNRRTCWTLRILLIAAAVAVVLLQLAVSPPPGYFDYDEAIWFYPLCGFLSAVVLALVTKLLGFILKRRETYWESRP